MATAPIALAVATARRGSSSSKAGKVGVVISAPDTNWFEMTGGHAAGIHRVGTGDSTSFGYLQAIETAIVGKIEVPKATILGAVRSE